MKRNKNKKIVLVSTIVLGLTAITSSALAAYIITGGTKSDTGDVETTPIDVDNQVVDLDVGKITDKLLLYPEETVSDKTVSSDVAGKLTINIPLSVTTANKGLIEKGFTVSVEEKDGGTLVSSNYVKLPTTTTIDDGSFVQNSGNTSLYEYTLPLEWTWGTAFGTEGLDPVAYYNAEIDALRMTASQAAKALTDFQTAVTSCPGFTVTIALATA